MKKLLAGIVLSTLFFTANAQFSFGPKVGVNLNTATTTYTGVTIDPITANFNIGAFGSYKFSNNFAGQIEAFYSGEGVKYKYKGNPIVFTDKIGYLNIPLLIKYVSSGSFFAETGPQLGFVLSATESEADSTGSINIKSDINSTKFSWVIGLGFEFAHAVGLDIRYAAGLSAINANTTGGTNKGSVLSVGLYYAIHTKSEVPAGH
jgi:hypothetical protein